MRLSAPLAHSLGRWVIESWLAVKPRMAGGLGRQAGKQAGRQAHGQAGRQAGGEEGMHAGQ